MTDTDRIEWLEKIVKEGACPALVNDDNGHWAVVFEGFQNVPEGDGPGTILTTFFIEKDLWRGSIREAIDSAKKEYDSG